MLKQWDHRSNQLLGQLLPPHYIPMQKGERFRRSREEKQQPPAQRLLPSDT